MKSRISLSALAACLIALLAFGAAAFFDKPSASANDGGRFEFGSEIEHPFGEKTVKGAPFSAQVILEQTQTLANGSHISRKMTGTLYRDSEGRTRHELPRNGGPEMAIIDDNVAGVHLNLNLLQHTARKFNVGFASREIEERQHREAEEREQMEKAKATGRERAKKEAEPERRVESLGTQVFEGVQAEVTRFTLTIPAGMEGNDQPLEIVSERWYSPELQVVVMGKRSDPRMGELVYRLTNISRGEQSRSLFEAPADFTATEEKVEMRKRSSN